MKEKTKTLGYNVVATKYLSLGGPAVYVKETSIFQGRRAHVISLSRKEALAFARWVIKEFSRKPSK